MKPSAYEHFTAWMSEYGRASRENDPQASAELFSQDAKYYETPFDEPMVGREVVYQYWNQDAQNLKDKESSYEILSITDNLGIARWQSKFTVIETGKHIVLDCIFLVEFDADRKCSQFREWWHLSTIENHFPQRELDHG